MLLERDEFSSTRIYVKREQLIIVYVFSNECLHIFDGHSDACHFFKAKRMVIRSVEGVEKNFQLIVHIVRMFRKLVRSN